MNFPNRSIRMLALCGIVGGSSAVMSAEEIDLPLPSGLSIRFLPVFISHDSNLLADREFTMGDRSGEVLEEPLLPARLGGSFLRTNGNGKRGWCYFLARTEVTEAQWAEVMEDGAPENPELPKTGISYHDVDQFLHRYNLWLRSEKPGALPSNEGAIGYLRLPTEAEWEFACRGGKVVTEEDFDRQIPYESQPELLRREWLSGSDASSGALKPVGRSAGPNPLGFYDLLGNVAEMTSTPFSLPHLSGRVGGFTVRGGHVNTLPQQARSSLRGEHPFYRADGKSASGPLLGFRPVIGCDIFWNTQTLSKIEEDAQKAETIARVPQSVAVKQSQVGASKATADELAKAEDRINRLLAQFEEIEKIGERSSAEIAEERKAVSAQIALLQGNLENAQFLIEERDRNWAESSARLAGQFGIHFVVSMSKSKFIPGEPKVEDPPAIKKQKEEAKLLFYGQILPQQKQLAEVNWTNLTNELRNLFNFNEVNRRKAFSSVNAKLPPGDSSNFQRNILPLLEKLAADSKPGVQLDRERVYQLLKAADPLK